LDVGVKSQLKQNGVKTSFLSNNKYFLNIPGNRYREEERVREKMTER
jgi:hypothetical protein